MRSRVPLAAVGALVALAAPPPASAARVSDEHSYTRTAEVRRVAVVRVRPRADSRVVARLHRWTEDRWPEVYLLLRSRERVKGHRWIEIRLPGRPNGATGWVPADALRRPRLTRWALVVDRSDLRVRLLRRGRVVWTRPVGIGRRPLGVRDERVLAALRVAGRRRRRHARHRPAGAGPGPAVARLHPAPQRGHPLPGAPRPGRDATPDSRLIKKYPLITLPG